MDFRNHIQFCMTYLILHIVAGTKNSPVVTTSDGQLRGIEVRTRDGRPYFAFVGVPYSRVTARFEPAQPNIPWSGIRDATEFGAVCPQLLTGSTTVIGNEDCLFLNVFTSNLTGSSPVIVYIHEGSFMTGSGNVHGGSYFLDEDVVLVTINYRLGALGFLSTGDEVIQGNVGLKDQNAALKWIKKNAEVFGGSELRISVMGANSGAASVAYHLLSPMSKGIFHRAILQSGSSLDPGEFEFDPLPHAVDLAESLDCPTFPTSELADCLRDTDFRKIVQIKLSRWHLDPLVQYPPTREVLRPGQNETELFLSESPYVSLLNGRFNKVPTVIGITEDEGLLFHSAFILRRAELQRNMNEDWNYVAPITLYYDERYIPTEARNQISRTIRGFYFGDRKVEPRTSRNLTNLYSDRLFNWGVRTTALLQSKFAPVYIYIFGYVGDYSFLQLYYGDMFQEPIAATHGDDLQYFFNSTRYPNLQSDSRSEEISKALIRLWTSFAASGNMMSSLQTLKVAWLPIGPEELRRNRLKWCYIDTESRILSKEPFAERMEFWDKMFQQHFNIYQNAFELKASVASRPKYFTDNKDEL